MSRPTMSPFTFENAMWACAGGKQAQNVLSFSLQVQDGHACNQSQCAQPRLLLANDRLEAHACAASSQLIKSDIADDGLYQKGSLRESALPLQALAHFVDESVTQAAFSLAVGIYVLHLYPHTHDLAFCASHWAACYGSVLMQPMCLILRSR